MMRHLQSYLLAAFLSLAGVITPMPSNAQSSCTAQSSFKQVLDQQEAGWNSGNSVAFSAAFTEDADFINIRGDVFHGRAAIVEQHRRIFAAPFAGSHNTITIRQCTDIATGVALIETVHEVTGFKFLPPGIVATSPGLLRTRMKYVAVKHGDEWRLVAAQNTAILPTAAMPPH